MIPRPIAVFTPPAKPEGLSKRLHNRFAKEAAREVMVWHHRKILRKHFQLGAAGRYGYFRRSAAYLRRKKRLKGHTLDLLYSGRTRQAMTGSPPAISLGGAAEGGKKGLTARYRLRFSFTRAVQESARRRRQRGAVSRPSGRTNPIPRMARELERWAADETRQARDLFLSTYMQRVAAYRGN